nr:Tat pathway signal sequence domain protein [Actinacidiphila soli]
MRKKPLLSFGLACAALLLGAGPALADGSSPSPTKAPASAAPSAVPTVASTSQPSRSYKPTTAPVATKAPGQVSSVPEGAPDTGVPTAGGSNATVVAGALGAAAALGGAGVVVMRRRSKVRG